MLHDWVSAWYPPTRQVRNPGYPATCLPDWYAFWPQHLTQHFLNNWAPSGIHQQNKFITPKFSAFPTKITWKIWLNFLRPPVYPFFVFCAKKFSASFAISCAARALLKNYSVHTNKLPRLTWYRWHKFWLAFLTTRRSLHTVGTYCCTVNELNQLWTYQQHCTQLPHIQSL